jgi:hypothetical protein
MGGREGRQGTSRRKERGKEAQPSKSILAASKSFLKKRAALSVPMTLTRRGSSPKKRRQRAMFCPTPPVALV